MRKQKNITNSKPRFSAHLQGSPLNQRPLPANGTRKGTIVSASLRDLHSPVPAIEFTEAVINACDVLFGRVAYKLHNARGFQVPSLPADAPLNRSLLVLQNHMIQAGRTGEVVLAAVHRFLALIQSPLHAPELGALVQTDENGDIVGMTVKLIRAAATASMVDMDPTKPEFRAIDLCSAAALVPDTE